MWLCAVSLAHPIVGVGSDSDSDPPNQQFDKDDASQSFSHCLEQTAAPEMEAAVEIPAPPQGLGKDGAGFWGIDMS